jgi:hypothetical protein
MIALIGNGLIGKRIQSFINVDHVFTSKNINTLNNYKFDLIYIAAPSGNRVWAEDNPAQDTNCVNTIIDYLQKQVTARIILISSGDTQIRPDTVYGYNRLNLENYVKDNFKEYHIIRLPSLIGREITKNMLYDIKHNTPWVEKINADAWLQWYPLDRLAQDLSNLNLIEYNLCSEPIQGWEIINNFAPNLKLTTTTTLLKYDLKPYSISKQEIFDTMRDYLK